MVAEVFGGISALKAALDIVKTIKDASDVATRQGIVIKLQEQILSAQQAQFSLVEKVRALEEEMTRFETWDTEKDRYQLKQLGSLAFVYILKIGAANGEPLHWLCANCYQNRKKRLLQYVSHGSPGPDYTKDIWRCPDCGSQIVAPLHSSPGNEHP
jgi:hypothetical protein